MEYKNSDMQSPEEARRFAALPRERAPADSLENRIVSTLKSKGLIRMTTSTRFWTLPRLAGALSAAVVLLAIGFGMGRWQSRPAHDRAEQSMFVLFLYHSPAMAPGDSSRAVEYSNWAKSIRQSQRTISGEKLEDGGRVLRREQGQVAIRDGYLTDEKNMLGGYFLIQAANYEEAAKIAASCPHLKHGGVIELRQIARI